MSIQFFTFLEHVLGTIQEMFRYYWSQDAASQQGVVARAIPFNVHRVHSVHKSSEISGVEFDKLQYYL
jgi:hypothetical protein